jgi:glutamine cyclotransferase
MRATVLSTLLLCGLCACEGGVQPIDYEVLRTLPHDPEAYTQGLVFHEGFLFESTGRHGASSVRKTDLASGEILQITPLAEEYFGEGLALVGSELVQLTWQSGRAFVYDAESLKPLRTLEYEGEGWGLCYDGEALFMTDGTDRLLRRDPRTFEVLGEQKVTENGLSVWRLNELECVDDYIYANVFPSARIVRIDKYTGRVVSELDGFRLSANAGRVADPEAVLNGIAHNPETGTLFVTGKLWDRLFEVVIR